ncbi:uncharacterized protein VTP21DRAFT_7086 [Calcarisporiella thermophila]|uniref:uncharacterized protein n=1 Tax=Calcarisporiella thermophila TaxID=911321 RepID=UPI003743916C
MTLQYLNVNNFTFENPMFWGAFVVGLIYYFFIRDPNPAPPEFYRIPRLPTWDIVRGMLSFKPINLKESIHTARKRAKNTGVLRYTVMGRKIVRVTDPKLVKEVLHRADNFPKRDFSQDNRLKHHLFSKFAGTNIVMVNGETWRRYRKVVNPAFHRSWDTQVFGGCVEVLDQVIEKNLDCFDSAKAFQGLTLDILGKALFNYNFDAVKNPDSEIVVNYEKIMKVGHPIYFFLPILDKYPFGQRRIAHQKVEEFHQLLSNIIAQKRQEIREKKQEIVPEKADLLTLMLLANSNELGETTLTDKELRDNLVLFFIAGHDTTASALISATYFMAKHPECQAKARDEVYSVLGDSPQRVIPTFEQQKQFSYLNLVMRESMRHFPPVVRIGARRTTSDQQLGEYIIPAGTSLELDVLNVHHDIEFWGKDADEFRPERFNEIDEKKRRELDSMHYIPFSTGSRFCLGMSMSLVEQRVVLSMLLHKYEWTLAPESLAQDEKDLCYGRSLLVRPVGIKLKFKKRY